ncbi:MAG TPA: phosphate ABC transporter permease PstA [Thermoanaerobaculia bacterium]|nr:phosphate ABC transporter permease PstA [Thermoanaerobaculia bacterium]
MSDAPASGRHPLLADEAVRDRLRKRKGRDRRFRLYCIAAIGLALTFLVVLFVDIARKGWSGFTVTTVRLPVFFDPEVINPGGTLDSSGRPGRPDAQALMSADYATLWREPLKARFPVEGREQRRALYGLLGEAATYRLRDMVVDDPALIGKRVVVWLPSSTDVDQVHKGKVPRSQAEGGLLDDQQLAWLTALEKAGDVRLRWNGTFFTSGDSRDPQQAGILAALLGSFYAILVTLLISFPLGVAAAVYLEELAPKNRRWLDMIEVNINNLAAVPSIVFGLLGLAVFLNVFGLPRSSPLAGGMILSLMTLPVIIIAGRAALQAVPPSIRHAAYALGATPLQVIQHHVLPMAMPGILTGTIIGLARAVGESAPLLMVGMVAFVVDPPKTPLDPASALPVQVYLWADSPERGFVEKTSAAILVLLAFLIAMNSVAVILRRRWERRL